MVVHDQPAIAGEYPARALRPGKQGRLGERLGFNRVRAERGGADQPGPGGLTGGRVDQVVGVATVVAAPDADVQPRGRDRAAAEAEAVGVLAAERVLDEHVERLRGDRRPADAEIAAAVDDEAGVGGEPLGDQIGGKALADPAAVEAHARRASDQPERLVDLDLSPARSGVR